MKANKTDLKAIEKYDHEYLYDKGIHYLDENEDDAKYYLELSAIMGDVDAIYELGNLYKDNKQYEKALSFYMLAEEMGNIDAIYELALMYHNGLGVEKDDELSTYYITMGLDSIENSDDPDLKYCYPDLYYAAAEDIGDDSLVTRYYFLTVARDGYEMFGDDMYKKIDEELDKKKYDDVRNEVCEGHCHGHCDCGENCNCGCNCDCGDNCECGDDCTCGCNCNCGENCECGDDCTCGCHKNN